MTATDPTFTTDFGDILVETDAASIPAEPPKDIVYNHKVKFFDAVRTLWANREVMFTLAERDFRAQYKQATLGVGWAVLSPVASLVIFVVIFSHVKSFQAPNHLPYALYAFVGIMCWTYFSSSLGGGGNSLLSNKALLAKTQFPRECFPLETMLVNAISTAISWIPLAILFVIFGRAPALTTLWAPLFIVIEVVMAAGITMAIASLVVQARDLVQLLPLITSLGLFATPVIWPFSKIPADYHVAGGHYVPAHINATGHHVNGHWVGGLHVNLQMVYGFFNPLGPVIDNARRTMLIGLQPEWRLVGIAALGALTYLLVGYRIFKRLEVHFADVA